MGEQHEYCESLYELVVRGPSSRASTFNTPISYALTTGVRLKVFYVSLYNSKDASMKNVLQKINELGRYLLPVAAKLAPGHRADTPVKNTTQNGQIQVQAPISVIQSTIPAN